MIWRAARLSGIACCRAAARSPSDRQKRATFATPPLEGKSKFLLLQPRRDGYVLHLASALKGELTLGGVATPVAGIASRDVDLARGDKAKLIFADGSDVRLELRWVDPPDVIARPRIRDPQMVQITVGTSIVLGALAVWLEHHVGEDGAEATAGPHPAQRVAKIEAPAAIEFEKKEVKKQKEEEAEEVDRERRADQARQGEGRPHRPQRRHPQGHGHSQGEGIDPAREGPEGRHPQHHRPRQGARLGALQAVRAEQRRRAGDGRNGRRQMVVGHGAGGLTTSGSGPGGGGTGYGHIYGAGNLDTGGRGTHGRGRGPKLAERGEHEVSVGLGTGGGDTDGSLSKEQVYKVVKAHFAGVKYCYEKELQHKSSLSGNIDIFWVIQPDGTVSKANVKSSAMNDVAVEGCIVRQVKQWQFPKAPGQTIVGRFPFVFKGGS